MRKGLLCLVSVFILMGCSSVQEIGKTVWGSSTRQLEHARANAIVRVYDKSYWDCMTALVDSAIANEYVLFKRDEVRGYLVVMGIKGSVNTTEVGIFAVELNDNQTRVEISSLSTNAKRIVAKAVFDDLDVRFGLKAPVQVTPTSEDVTQP